MGVEVGLPNKLLAEFIGTTCLVLTVSCNVLGATSPAWAAASIASVLMVMIYALGHVSGAHFNPAVTVAVTLADQQKWVTSVYYIITQLVAGVFAGFLGKQLFGHSFNLEPGQGYTWLNAASAEFLYTFMLCFVVLNTACSRSSAGNQYFGLAIGYTIVAGGYATGKISGAAFNPAVAFGIDASSANLGFGWSLAYSAWEVLGAAAAVALYRVVRPEEFGQRANGLLEKLTCEFLGTYFLVLTVGLNVLTGSAAAAFSIGASLMCWIYALGPISGGHYNPAVTLAILFAGRNKISTQDAIAYMCTQVGGGLAAAFTYGAMTGNKSVPLGPVGGNNWLNVFLVEAVFTFVLTYVVLAVATTRRASKDMFGLAIGACVVVGGFAAGSVSGGSLNPAVSIGLDVSHAIHTPAAKFLNCVAYSAFEAVGAGAAALAFINTHPDEYSKSSLKG